MVETMQREVPTGTYNADGNERTIETNRKIKSVRVIDISLAMDVDVYKTDQMPSGSAVMDRTIGGALKRASIAADAITINGTSFTVGTNSYVNTSGHDYIWEVEWYV